ncbi:hypothetical protein [Nocardia brasiliensis]|nr:hypothetical protein [Nocardia brasiliensis]
MSAEFHTRLFRPRLDGENNREIGNPAIRAQRAIQNRTWSLD